MLKETARKASIQRFEEGTNMLSINNVDITRLVGNYSARGTPVLQETDITKYLVLFNESELN